MFPNHLYPVADHRWVGAGEYARYLLSTFPPEGLATYAEWASLRTEVRLRQAMESVDASILEKTSLTTHCPYKGDASYWSIRVEDHIVENAIWAYEDPIPAAMPIKGHMAFYTKKVDIYDADLPALD